jgi:hypothetical protein
MTTPHSSPAWDLDTLRAQWQAQDAKLDALLQLNRRLARTQLTGRFRPRLRLLTWRISAGLLVLAPALLWLGAFAFAHRANARFLAPAVLLLLCAIALLITGVRQLVLLHDISLDAPVVTLQTQFEAVRIERLRATVAALAAGPLLWLPVLLVATKGWFGVDLYAVASGAWLAANLAFGALVLVVVHVLVRRQRGPTSGRWDALRSLLSGETMADAHRFLDDLAALDDASPEAR